jgi:sugar lactone lactonase YvrE
MPNRRLPALVAALALASGCAPKAGVTGVATTTKPAASASPAKAAAKLTREVLKAPAGASTRVQGTLVVDAAYLVKAGEGQVISTDGSSAVYPAASLIGNDGASIVAQGAGNIISTDGSSIITNDGASLVGAQARRLLAADAVAVNDQVAAGFAVRAIGLADNKPVPLGVDAAGKPVYVVLTDAKGGYDLHLPANLPGGIRLVASPPGLTDPRATLNLLVGTAGAVDQRFTEPASTFATYVRHLIITALRPAVVGSDDGGQGRANQLADQVGGLEEIKPVVDKAYQAAHEEHVERLTPAAREFALQRFADALIAYTDLDKVGVGNYEGYKGDSNELARHAFEDLFGRLRTAAARTMAADPDSFNQRPYLVAANGRRKAAGQAPVVVRKASDLGDFLVEEYCRDVTYDHAKQASEVLADAGIEPNEVFRLMAMNSTVGYALGVTALTHYDEAVQFLREAIREQLGANPPRLPAAGPVTNPPVAAPIPGAETYAVSTLPGTESQGVWHMTIGPDGALYYVVVGPGPAVVRRIGLAEPGQPNTVVSDAVPSPLGLAFDPKAAVPTLYVADPTNRTITRVLPGPPEVLTLPEGTKLGEMHQIACTQDHALIVAQAKPTAVLRIDLQGDHAVKVLAGTSVGTQDFLLSIPSGLAVAPDGGIYLTDGGHGSVMRLQDGKLQLLAGREGAGGVDGFYNDARFRNPQALAVAPDGSLLVSDSVSNAVRRVRFAQGAGVVSTLAGDAKDGSPGLVEGDGAGARFNTTTGIAVDAKGVIYVGDGNFRIRVLTPN